MLLPKHSYTKYITVLNEKANKFNYFALYCYCKAKIINIKRLVISHLKSCNKFEKQYSKNERNRILFPERYEEIQEKDQTEGESFFSYEQNFSFPFSSLSYRSSFSSFSLSHCSSFSTSFLSQHSHELEISPEEESANKKRKTKITHYMPRLTPFSKQEYTQWEDLVLNFTINNGWSFRWSKVLAGRILNTNSEYIKKSLIDTVRKDELGVTVCFDGWKNVKKQEIIGSEIKEFTLNFLSDLDKQDIKYNAVITDSASSNQAARKRLAPEWQDIFFGLCFAHQTNLIVLISKYAPEEFDQEDEAIYHSGKEGEMQNNKYLPFDICKTIDNDIW
ncbi:hypothetical protein GLOIN_2v201639 [Rhizophagus clarus]|uniref:DUF659 domain-containing protein n=1 Tax=Rhizophagus clarus TaxID=94130 RepID=A0A8H3QTS6_9GLOM|nr:hypothetical protein GLOIN_2v201639 [Rhizophagus clarus]